MSGIKLSLTPRQAKFLWSILDGALDAGACADGLTVIERRTGNAIMSKLLPHIAKMNRKAPSNDRR